MSAAAPGLRLLLIEDDQDLATLLSRILHDEGYLVDHVSEGPQGLRDMLAAAHDIVILDRGLPSLEGVELLRTVRSRRIATPVLILSARGSAHDRVSGIEAGAEDYLTKPFDIGELLARLLVLLRRRPDKPRHLTFGALRLDTVERTITETRTDRILATLSEREASLLEVLARSPGRISDRSELRELVFTHADSDAAVESYVHYVRRKLGESVIVTVRGFGYRIGSP